MFFYRYFAGFGRDDLADASITADPFSLPPAEIVERVMAQGLIVSAIRAHRAAFVEVTNPLAVSIETTINSGLRMNALSVF